MPRGIPLTRSMKIADAEKVYQTMVAAVGIGGVFRGVQRLLAAIGTKDHRRVLDAIERLEKRGIVKTLPGAGKYTQRLFHLVPQDSATLVNVGVDPPSVPIDESIDAVIAQRRAPRNREARMSYASVADARAFLQVVLDGKSAFRNDLIRQAAEHGIRLDALKLALRAECCWRWTMDCGSRTTEYWLLKGKDPQRAAGYEEPRVIVEAEILTVAEDRVLTLFREAVAEGVTFYCCPFEKNGKRAITISKRKRDSNTFTNESIPIG